jgi:hypothetical protein
MYAENKINDAEEISTNVSQNLSSNVLNLKKVGSRLFLDLSKDMFIN